MNRILVVILLALLALAGCTGQLNFDSPDNSILITGNDTTDTVYFVANVTGTGGGNCSLSFGVISTAAGNITCATCNETLNLTSADNTITFGVNDATNTLNMVLTNTYLQNIVEDLTPQLGGNLDGQTFTITAEGITSTIPDNANKVGLTVNQLDVTNNPIAAYINNDGTSHALSIVQDGVLAAIQNGLYVRSNTAQVNSPLVHFWMSNAASDQYVLKLTNSGTGSGLYIDQDGNGEGILVNNDGTNHGLYVSQGGVTAANDYALFVYSNVAQVNSPLAYFYQSHAGSTQGVLKVANAGTGDSVFIDNNGDSTSLEIDSEATSATGILADFQNSSGDVFNLSVGGSEVFAVDWQGNVTIANAYSLPITDGALNEVLTTNGAGVVSWAAGGGGGCSDVWKTINADAGTDPVASGCTDTLNLTSADGSVTITGNAGTDTIDFSAVPDLSGYVAKSLFDANTMLYATADNTPLALTITEQTVVGRLTGGNIAAVAMGIADNNVVQIDAADVADNEYARFTAVGLESRTAAEVKADLAVSLDNAYEVGSTVTADVADVLWTLNAAGIDHIINMASTGDVIIQDGGAAVHTWTDSGEYQIDCPATLNDCIDINQTRSEFSTTSDVMTITSTIPNTVDQSNTPGTYRGLYIQHSNYAEHDPTVGGFDASVYGAQISVYNSPVNITDADFLPAASNVNGMGIYGGAGCHPTDGSTQNTVITSYGLYFGTASNPVLNKAGGTVSATVKGVYSTASLNPGGTSPTLITGTIYGVHTTATGTTEGTQTTYGIHATGTGADDNYSGYFTRNLADDAPVVYIKQDNAGGLGAVLELVQDDTDEPFIDFTGTSSADSSPSFTTRIIVELNGTNYYLYLDPV